MKNKIDFRGFYHLIIHTGSVFHFVYSTLFQKRPDPNLFKIHNIYRKSKKS